MDRYAIARFPTPVLNTPAFQKAFGKEKGDCLDLDEQHLLRPIEMVLFPHSKITLRENVPHSPIWRISTQEYPHIDDLYIDERFVAFVEKHVPQRKRILPSRDHIIALLLKQVGLRYVWGGNWPEGIPQLLEWYRPSTREVSLNALTHDTWQLKGLDCSGLLYFAANGCTPRNTSQLVEWGEAVSISGKPLSALVASLLPLDIIVWKGHVIIALDSHTLIESKEKVGVVLASVEKRLAEILEERKPQDVYTSEEPSFVIRRWYQSTV